MPRTLFLALLAAPALVACGGGSAPTFADATSALEQADFALAGGDLDTALAGYRHAAEHAQEPALQRDAWAGLYRTRVEQGDAEGAVAAFESLSAAHGEDLAFEELVQLADAALEGRLAKPAGAVIDYAAERFPGRKAELGKQADAVELLETQGPGADLSDLGYAGG